MKEREEIVLHFEGDEQINLKTLISTLESVLSSLKTISSVMQKDNTIEYIVKPFERGSFSVIIGILSPVILEYGPFFISMIGTGLVEFLRIKKFLKGEKPTQVINNTTNNTVVIVNSEGARYETADEVLAALTKTKTVDKEITTAFKTLLNDKSRTNLDITVTNKQNGEVTTESVSKAEMPFLTTPLDFSDLQISGQTQEIRIWVKVIRISFEGTDKWKFGLPSGEDILAMILDEKFMFNVHQRRYSFNAETRLLVDLTIATSFPNDSSRKKVDYIINKVVDINDEEHHKLIEE